MSKLDAFIFATVVILSFTAGAYIGYSWPVW